MPENNRSPKRTDSIVKRLLDGSLFKVLENRDALLFYTLYNTGCSVSDLVNIRVKDFRAKANSLTILSTRKQHEGKIKTEHHIDYRAKRIFEKYIETRNNDDFLFSGKKNGMSQRRVEQIIKEIAVTFGSCLTTPSKIRKLFVAKTLQNPKGDVNSKTRLKSLKIRKQLTKKELKAVINASNSMDKRNAILIETMLETGIRISELVQLPTNAISKKSIRIDKTISHNKKIRHARISNKLYNKIKHFSIENQEFLFTNKSGKSISIRRFQQVCKEIKNSTGIDITPSILRSTAIYILHKNGIDVEEQAGLKSGTYYTYGIISTENEKDSISNEKEKDNLNTEGIRSRNEQARSTQYYKSRYRNSVGENNEK